MKTTNTYDVHFNSNDSSDSKGFGTLFDAAKSYIAEHNGTNHSYFRDYKGGTVSVVCNETGETVFSTIVK